MQDKQRAFQLAEKLCRVRSSGASASLLDQALESAVSVEDNHVKFKYHAMKLHAAPTLQPPGSPESPSAFDALMPEATCIRFEVRPPTTYLLPPQHSA